MTIRKKQKTATIYLSDPDRLSPAKGKGQYGARIAVPFSTKDPLQMAAYSALALPRSEAVRELLGIETYKQLVDAAEAAGMKPAAYIRTRVMRLRFAASPAQKRTIVARVRRQLGADLPRVTPFSSVGVNIEDAPEPVRRLIDRYAPAAKRILDPFGGTGNVAIVAAERGLESYWCEIDPLVRAVAQLKIDLLIRTKEARRGIARELRDHKNRMRTRITMHDPATDLTPLRSNADVSTYARRCRTYVDKVAASSPLVGRALEAAVAEALARAYEGESAALTQSEKKGVLEMFRAAIEQEISSLIWLLHENPALSRIPQFLAADASTLGDIVPVQADVVITSPPSLTIDEAAPSKPARWFMRIAADAELPAPQATSVDVLRKVLSGAKIEKRDYIQRQAIGFDVIETVRGLREEILKLDDEGQPALAHAVSRYFVQMGRTIAAVNHHLADDATFILDVSDYASGDARVDTDELFASLLRHYGFTLEEALPISLSGAEDERTRRVVVFRRRGGSRPKS